MKYGKETYYGNPHGRALSMFLLLSILLTLPALLHSSSSGPKSKTSQTAVSQIIHEPPPLDPAYLSLRHGMSSYEAQDKPVRDLADPLYLAEEKESSNSDNENNNKQRGELSTHAFFANFQSPQLYLNRLTQVINPVLLGLTTVILLH
ncbi:hypothetical protein [Fodinibius sediminis]|uniref:Uncharacterized protein n=1 Tax=Fodinibius sediminis TaxID=1214077 RepID=A0A521DXF4_9BACT|nr:hypothetical protein [Fodinibius sediminis]SMO76399.1 hypothetical protein SAMN06265218_11241 [Fodinibius sediminis]